MFFIKQHLMQNCLINNFLLKKVAIYAIVVRSDFLTK